MESAAPLTHHQIMALAGPFVRRGWQVDLAATDRTERRLAFRALEHAAVPGVQPVCREWLTLEPGARDGWRLVRTLGLDRGLEARLEIEGAAPETLLSTLERLPLAMQFRMGDDWLIAWHQRLQVEIDQRADPGPPLLVAARAEAAGIGLTLRMSRVASVPADVLLALEVVDAWQLPDDLLALLGRRWSAWPRRSAEGWSSTLLLRGRPEQRSLRGALEFERAVRHVARTLSEPPAAFHPRCAAARRMVALRRAAPLVLLFGLMAGAVAVQRSALAADSALRMLVFNSPPLLLVLMFSLRELPRLTLPRWPGSFHFSHWRREPT